MLSDVLHAALLQDNIAEVEMEDGSDAEKEEASPQPVSSR